jgi:hypothetical protein
MFENTKTNRGFQLIKSVDRYGQGFSIQESSLASEAAIWFGIDDPNPQIMASKVVDGGTGWAKYPIPDDVHITTRMHLTVDQVKGIIPILQHFVDTGELGGIL